MEKTGRYFLYQVIKVDTVSQGADDQYSLLVCHITLWQSCQKYLIWSQSLGHIGQTPTEGRSVKSVVRNLPKGLGLV